jgi:hypothetical protein
MANEADPPSYSEAMSCKHESKRKVAMDDEIEALNKNATFTLTILPSNRQALTSKWIFKEKYDANGNPYKHRD